MGSSRIQVLYTCSIIIQLVHTLHVQYSTNSWLHVYNYFLVKQTSVHVLSTFNYVGCTNINTCTCTVVATVKVMVGLLLL